MEEVSEKGERLKATRRRGSHGRIRLLRYVKLTKAPPTKELTRLRVRSERMHWWFVARIYFLFLVFFSLPGTSVNTPVTLEYSTLITSVFCALLDSSSFIFINRKS